jgi:hypothetical protein
MNDPYFFDVEESNDEEDCLDEYEPVPYEDGFVGSELESS